MPWWLVGGGRGAKRAALDRLLAASPQVRWVLDGDEGGPDPALFADLARRAPGRVVAIGLRQMLEPCGPRTELTLSERVHGVPVVRAPNGMELLPAFGRPPGRAAPRGSGADWFLGSAERGDDITRLRAWTEGNAVHPLAHGASTFRARRRGRPCRGRGRGRGRGQRATTAARKPCRFARPSSSGLPPTC